MSTQAKFSFLSNLAKKQNIILLSFILISPTCANADVHASITGTNNNVDRWFSKSNSEWAIKADVDYEHSSGFYGGSKLGTIKFVRSEEDDETNMPVGQPAAVEITPYVGYTYTFNNDWKLGTEVNRYIYTGDICGHPADYNEYYLITHYQDLVTAKASLANDFWGTNHNVFNYETIARYPVTDFIDVSGGGGYSATRGAVGSDHAFWNAGFTYFYKIVSLDFRYMDATKFSVIGPNNGHMFMLPNKDAYEPPIIDSTFVFSVSAGI